MNLDLEAGGAGNLHFWESTVPQSSRLVDGKMTDHLVTIVRKAANEVKTIVAEKSVVPCPV